MTSLYLIRHGQASFGQENYDQLSELGQLQAVTLGKALSQRIPVFDAVCLGSMMRHAQTAKNCLSQFQAPPHPDSFIHDAGWNEYDHQDVLRQYRPEFESATSMMAFIRAQDDPKQAFEDNFNGAVDRWVEGDHDADYVESWSDFTARIQHALKRTLANHSNVKSVAVFTSGGPISLVSQALLGVPQEKIMQMNWTLVNCGITKVVATGSRIFLSCLNEHSHFEGEGNKHFITYS